MSSARTLSVEGGRLGWLASTPSTRSKKREIDLLFVSKSDSGELYLEFTSSDSAGGQVVVLTPRAALEIVKGLLLKMPILYAAADDELVSITRGIAKAGEQTSESLMGALGEEEAVPPPKGGIDKPFLGRKDRA